MKGLAVMDLEYLERWSERGKAVYAREVTRLLKSFGTSFNEPPHYLQVSIRRISLTDQATQKEGGGRAP